MIGFHLTTRTKNYISDSSAFYGGNKLMDLILMLKALNLKQTSVDSIAIYGGGNRRFSFIDVK